MQNLFGNLTEEELRKQSEAFGDFEYVAEQTEIQGEFGADQIQADRVVPLLNEEDLTAIRSDGSYLKGFTIPQESRQLARDDLESGSTRVVDEAADRFKFEFELAGKDSKVAIKEALVSEAPTIFTIGSQGNTGATGAHEFRHVAFDVLRNLDAGALDTPEKNKALSFIHSNIPKSGDQEEMFNRQFDQYRDDTEESLITLMQNNAIQRTKRNVDVRSFGKEGRQEELDKAVKQIRKRAQKFSGLEAAASQMKGLKPPKGSTWKEFYFKQFLSRQSIAISQATKYLNREK